MHLLDSLLRLSLLILAAVLPSFAAAASSHPITAALQASFPRPPLLLELLEAAADENSTCFYPLIETIATGRFHSKPFTDQELFEEFERLLREDGHLSDPHSLASWRFAVGIHATAPRIEAHYQYWNTAVEAARPEHELSRSMDAFEDGSMCVDLECTHKEKVHDRHQIFRNLDFDHVPRGRAEAIIYADPASKQFPVDFLKWKASSGGKPYILRYAPGHMSRRNPLVVTGYGVELALKKTDYIVIDDRGAVGDEEDVIAEEPEQVDSAPIAELDLDIDDAATEVRRLSSSELKSLGLRLASLSMASEDPFRTLLKLSQDLPKYASTISAYNTSREFLTEYRSNREKYLPAGYSAMWMNGKGVSARDFDAYAMLDSIRRERKFISEFEPYGLSAMEAVSVLSHEAVANAQSDSETQRYDWTDELEGGDLIIWLNNLEKDKRYDDFSPDLTMLLQRMFPGQMPQVKKDIHNIVIPLDLSSPKDISLAVDQVQVMIKRGVPVRFGLVPSGTDASAEAHARVVFHLYKAYGLTAMLDYLDLIVKDKKVAIPSDVLIAAVTEQRTLRKNQADLSLEEIRSSEALSRKIDASKHWLARLRADAHNPPFFVNGLPMTLDEEWLQAASQRIHFDLRDVQLGVYHGRIKNETWIPSIFLKNSTPTRNPLLIPETDDELLFFDLDSLMAMTDNELATTRAFVASDEFDRADRTSLVIIGDLNQADSAELVLNAAEFCLNHPEIELRALHQCRSVACEDDGFYATFTPEGMMRIQDKLQLERTHLTEAQKDAIGQYLTESMLNEPATPPQPSTTKLHPIVSALGLKAGDTALLLNGRLVGPIPTTDLLKPDDFDTLLSYENQKRIRPIETALETLQLSDKLTGPLAKAKLASLVAMSTTSDVPEGIFDDQTGPRFEPYAAWATTYSSFSGGDESTAKIKLVAALDPASELGQRWISILKVLSELDGVFVRVFLNPHERLKDLPVKRFYRHVLEAAPRFNDDGSMADIGASFIGIPEDALLTMGLDVPPAWLVAPQKCVDDLDNIKLSNVKDPSGIHAVYELEHILVEGHSRDTTVGSPPRGTQLTLSTETTSGSFTPQKDESTLVMANLGYFQFKSSPGLYKLGLLGGASQYVFSLDSAGTKGYNAQAGDETVEVLLSSFKGATIFPRLSRRPGREKDDVLEVDTATASVPNIVGQASTAVDSLLSKAGVRDFKAGPYIAKYAKAVQQALGPSDDSTADINAKKQHADINIFSVASGHLYERMLNIMMVSVMRHTNHTVKFWFIEQFLSPSFKSFLPTMAAEYGFEYEMVTYKWPHWLREQKEKQRIIWGYKILFLDVLFPLDLDKVIFVDADQIVRTDMYELIEHDLEGAVYGFTPMGDSREEMEGFRFWKQGYWKDYLRGRPYHISALYVVDLKAFRAAAAGDRLRQTYHSLSGDPNSLSNLDQDLPNHMQFQLKIHSLPQDWLWCETWCDDESLKTARTIDLCNNPLTKEPKLDRARRQVPEWTEYDDEIAALARGPSIEEQLGITANNKFERVKVNHSEGRVHSEVRDKQEL